MKISIVCVGKLKISPELTLIQRYLKRFDSLPQIKEIEIKKKLPSSTLKDEEGKALLSALPDSGFIIVLDETGIPLPSQSLASKLNELQIQGISHVAFVIGGADGLSDAVKQRADLKISFGSMTWPHLLVRVMLVEQLYRCQQILKGHPYHRE